MKNITIKMLVLSLFTIMGNTSVICQSKADKLLGVYAVVEEVSKEESKVEFFKAKDGKYFAKIIWLKKPNFDNGKPKLDVNNPNPALKNKPADKILLAWGLSYDAKKDEYLGGEIYDPVAGKIYKLKVTMESDTKIKLRGYIGSPILGRTIYWQKVKK